MIGVHRVKIQPQWYKLCENGEKTCEIRYNDRDYNINDTIILCEYDLNKKEYTGKELIRNISHVLHSADCDGLKKGYVILSLTAALK